MSNLTTEVSNPTATNLEGNNLETPNLEETNLEEAIVTKIRELPRDKQQQILDFAEFLKTKLLVETTEKNPESELESQSFLELAQKYVGSVEAPEDLSTNKKYFAGFGE